MKLKGIINLLGGPGSGKSTIACGLFENMKLDGMCVEYVDEYAKEKTYEKEFLKLEDQAYIFVKQHRKIYRLANEVDYIVTDSPLLLSLVYFNDYTSFYSKNKFNDFVIDVFNKYPNYNYFLDRNNITYQDYGRNQSKIEAIEIDNLIKNTLCELNIEYSSFSTGPDTKLSIYNDFVKKLKLEDKYFSTKSLTFFQKLRKRFF